MVIDGDAVPVDDDYAPRELTALAGEALRAMPGPCPWRAC
jgi:hypothetical protein